MKQEAIQKVAYSYLRFSSPEQAKGDSFRRQFELASRYATANNLNLDESLSFHDLGVSAYRGANSETGQLGSLLEAVKTKLIPPGAVILVESLDRISRQSARKALRIIESIVELGVSIVTLADGREYTLESLDSDPLNLLMAILTFIRANEESNLKSQRISAAWEAKRKRAPSALITSCCPGWMHISPDKTSFVLIEQRVRIIKLIFNLAASGGTFCGIARTLNTQEFPPLRSRGVPGKFWTTSSVKMILESETVCGTLTPFTCRYADGKRSRTRLAPIRNYYPRIISQELFDTVQRTIAHRRSKTRGGPKRPTQNIIGFITRCGYCNSGMVKAYGMSGGYLICRNKFLHAGCSCESISYYEIERSFLKVLQQKTLASATSADRSLRIWASQIPRDLESADSMDKAELNRLIRRQCVAVKVFHDTGRMEVNWKTGEATIVPASFTPSFEKSIRSRMKARRLTENATR